MTRFRLLTAAVVALGLTLPAPAQQPAGPKLPAGVRAFPNLEYGPHERNKLDLYVPKSDTPLPLVIWVHGGGWEAGDKAGGPAMGLLGSGQYAVASVNYRFSKHAVFPAQATDVRAAVRFLRANAGKYDLDPDHFAAWGASAGGHLVALLGTAPEVKDLDGDAAAFVVSPKVQAVIDVFGPTDFPTLVPASAGAQNPVTRLLGGPLGEKKDLARLASPLAHVSKGDAPTLIFHGDQDKLVPVQQSEVFAEALKKAGVECELVVIKGAGHGGPDFASEANKKKIVAFLDKHLRGK